MKPWFKTQWCWLGWIPVTWQGWVVTVVILTALCAIFRAIDRSSHSVSDTLIAFFYPNGLALILLFLIICYMTGENPCWNWPASKTPSSAKASSKETGSAEEKTVITFDDFQKLDLRIAKIEKAERIESSEKLLRLDISLGSSRRQIVAGIGKAYMPETLLGKEIIIVANLEPRKLMGLESHGMLLAAHDTMPVLLAPEKDVRPGTKIS